MTHCSIKLIFLSLSQDFPLPADELGLFCQPEGAGVRLRGSDSRAEEHSFAFALTEKDTSRVRSVKRVQSIDRSMIFFLSLSLSLSLADSAFQSISCAKDV